MDNSELNITRHAYIKARIRFNWSKSTLDKMALRALKDGIHHSDSVGTLKSYLHKIYRKQMSCNNIRIYGENVYLFRNNKLVTLYRVENEMTKFIKAHKRKKINNGNK